MSAHSGLTHLGYLQRAALARLATSPRGLTTADMDSLSGAFTRGSRMTCLTVALRGLQDRGLAVTTGRVRPVSESGRGGPLNVWEATGDGRALARRAGAA